MMRILCRRNGAERVEALEHDQLAAALADPANVIWVDLDLTSEKVDEACAFLTRHFHFHPLALEDALIEIHLSRVDDWQGYLYLSFHALQLTDCLTPRELDLFLGPNYLVTIHFDPIPPLEKLWEQGVKSSNPSQTVGADRL